MEAVHIFWTLCQDPLHSFPSIRDQKLPEVRSARSVRTVTSITPTLKMSVQDDSIGIHQLHRTAATYNECAESSV